MRFLMFFDIASATRRWWSRLLRCVRIKAQRSFRRAKNSLAPDGVKQAVTPQRLKQSVGILLQSAAFLLFRPIHTLSLIRRQESFGLIRPKVIENLLIPAPIGLMFILREITHLPKQGWVAIGAMVLFLVIIWALPRFAAWLLSLGAGKEIKTAVEEQMYLMFLGLLPIYYFNFFDEHLSWIAIDMLADGLSMALSYVPTSIFFLSLLPLVVVPAVHLIWSLKDGHENVWATPVAALVAVLNLLLVLFFWGLADALQDQAMQFR
jgi:hypothetical protein